MPTAAERQGDFTQTLNRLGGAFTIYDPSTTVVSGGTATRHGLRRKQDPCFAPQPDRRRPYWESFPLPNQQTGPVQLAALNWAESKTYTVDQRQIGAASTMS